MEATGSVIKRICHTSEIKRYTYFLVSMPEFNINL
jgi:hypothetical protein